MEPMKSVMDQQTPLYRSQSPAQYALEVNKGWFERHKIKVGTQWNWASGGDEKSGTDQGPATSGQ